jgi:hypothetical protein
MGFEISRRHLLAGIAAAPLLSRVAMAARTSKLRFGFTTYQWGIDWDIPALIANCTKAKAFGVEVRTAAGYKHGIELTISADQRREICKRFADSPVKLVGIATPEKFDSPDPAEVRASMARAMDYVRLASDVGATGIRIFPNDWQKDVPHEQTIAQVARSLNELGSYAAAYGQRIRLENHGTMGRLTSLAEVMKQVTQKNVGIKLNCEPADARSNSFEANFNLVKPYLGDTMHWKDLNMQRFPYQLQVDLLIDANWDGWCLVEQDSKVPDRAQAFIEMQKGWQKLIDTSLARS